MARNYTKFDVDALRLLVAESTSLTEVAIRSGRKPVGGTLTAIRFQCTKHNISTDHMPGRAHRKGKPAIYRKTCSEILVYGNEHDRRTEAKLLRRALTECGVEYKCNGCGLTHWLGKPMRLEVDHIDERYWNNKLENLQYLCPNCHTMKNL